MPDEPNGAPPAPSSGNVPPQQAPSEPKPEPQNVKTINLLPDDYSAIQRELADLRAFQSDTKTKAEAAEAERLKVLAAKGQAEDAMNQLKSAYETKVSTLQAEKDATDQEWLAEKTASTIAEAMSGLEFAGIDPAVTAQHVRKLLIGEIEAVMGRDRKPVVRDRQTHQPASEYLKERISSPEFALYLKPSGKGGSGTDGTRTRALPPGQAQPGSLDAIVADWEARQGQYRSFGLHPSRS